MNYIEFSAEDFAAQESFQDYYFFQKKEASLFWEKWIAEHPDKMPEIERAKELLDMLSVQVSKQEVQNALTDLQESMKRKPAPSAKVIQLKRRKFIQGIGSIAAVLLIVCSAVYFLWQQPNVEWSITQTAFGETKEMHLPDGSQVYLNSNSTLKYDRNWTDQSIREVWLDGEAFFQVSEKPVKGAQKFTVNSNGTKVEVLGTVFNVYNRKEKVAVVLESGKVVVKYKKGKKDYEQEMQPNDLFEINANARTSYQQAINTQLHTAWKDNKLVLDETPLKKVVDILEDNFGFEVMVNNTAALERKLTATIPIIDINILLDALREIYGLKIKQEDRNIWIE